MSCECVRVVIENSHGDKTHVNDKVGVRQHLEVKGLVALVPHAQHRLQTVLAERDAVLQAEVVRPGLLELFAQVGGREAKVETYCIVTTLGQWAGL